MAKIIPNENSWIGFSTTAPASLSAPTETEVAAATTLTPYVVSITANAQGNTVPTPALDSLFDRTIIGTTQGSFQADMYRDSVDDLAWDTLPRTTVGYFYISRFGGEGTGKRPVAGNGVEVWPVAITQRAGSQMTSNTVQTFTVNAAVTDPPEENAIVVAGSGVPTAPLSLVGTKEANGVVVLDWSAPAFVGTGITGYTVSQSSTQNGSYSNLSAGANLSVTGTTARVSGLTTGTTYWFKVTASNAAGAGAAAGPVSVTA